MNEYFPDMADTQEIAMGTQLVDDPSPAESPPKSAVAHGPDWHQEMARQARRLAEPLYEQMFSFRQAGQAVPPSLQCKIEEFQAYEDYHQKQVPVTNGSDFAKWVGGLFRRKKS